MKQVVFSTDNPSPGGLEASNIAASMVYGSEFLSLTVWGRMTSHNISYFSGSVVG